MDGKTPRRLQGSASSVSRHFIRESYVFHRGRNSGILSCFLSSHGVTSSGEPIVPTTYPTLCLCMCSSDTEATPPWSRVPHDREAGDRRLGRCGTEGTRARAKRQGGRALLARQEARLLLLSLCSSLWDGHERVPQPQQGNVATQPWPAPVLAHPLPPSQTLAMARPSIPTPPPSLLLALGLSGPHRLESQSWEAINSPVLGQ